MYNKETDKIIDRHIAGVYDIDKKDHCSGFFEKWPQWAGIKWKMFDLSICCEQHDDEEDPQGGCASTEFIKCLFKNKVVGGILIFGVASIACWIKYPFKMIKRV